MIYKIGNTEIIRYMDDTEDTLVVTSEHLSECLNLIKTKNFKFILIDKSYDKTEIDFLKECTDIEKLTIYSIAVKDFNGLSFLTNLKVLALHLNNSTKLDVGDLSSLEELYGELPARTTGLSRLKNLKRVQIRSYKPRSKTFAELGEIENLEVLHLIQAQIESFEGIGQFKLLQELDLYGLNKLTDIFAIGLLRSSLRKLIMENCKNIQDFEPIRSLENLEYLTLRNCGSMKSIAFTEGLPKLNGFDFTNTNVEDGDLTYCQTIPTVHFTQKMNYSHKRKELTNFKIENIPKPILQWRERMEDGDDMFTFENISAAEKALDDFLAKIQRLNENASQKKMLTCVKEIVLKFNKLNEQYDYFIETTEREELVEYIVSVSELAGLETKGDITEEWREW
jgi:hypothetical protein